jgi:polyisoprenyl-phosphate glycosyltransferase
MSDKSGLSQPGELCSATPHCKESGKVDNTLKAIMHTTISIILPVYNESETLAKLKARLTPVLDEITRGSYEVLFVDDGSRDGSDRIIDDFHDLDPRFKAIHFSRNFGHQAALQAGLDAAVGDAVALMDADLQDPPEFLEQFIEYWRQGYDVVYAVRKKRKEVFWKRIAYSVFYRTMRVISKIEVPLDAGDFCLMDRRVVDTLVLLRERNRFLRGLRSWVGFRQIGVEFERAARHAGEPKYTLRKLVGLALSGYLGFSAVPLRLATLLGILTAGGGFLIALWAIIEKLIIKTPQGWSSLIAVTMLVGGVQLLMLGVIGEYLSRVYDDVRQRPIYIVKSRIGFDSLITESQRLANVRTCDNDQL